MCTGSQRKFADEGYGVLTAGLGSQRWRHVTVSNQAGKIDIPTYLPPLPTSALLKFDIYTSGIALDNVPDLFL